MKFFRAAIKIGEAIAVRGERIQILSSTKLLNTVSHKTSPNILDTLYSTETIDMVEDVRCS